MVSEVRIITGSFPHSSDAQAVVSALKARGFDEADISVVYTDPGHTVRSGLLSGAIWGGVFGAMFGLLFPPAGLLIAAGPIVGALASGASLGAFGALTVGGLNALVAGLIQLGLPEDVATGLGNHVHKGDTLVIVHAHTPEAAAQAEEVMSAHNPRPETTHSNVVPSATPGTTAVSS